MANVNDDQDPYAGAFGTTQNADYSKHWWENPAPVGWTGPWPPPLGPGDTYGAVQGQVNHTAANAQAEDLMDAPLAFGRAWQASGGKTPAELKAFADAHPQYHAELFGSKMNKVKIGGKVFKAISATSDPNAAANQWLDITNGEGGGGGNVDLTGQGINPTYLAPWTQEFQAPAGATLADFKAPTMNDDPSFDWRLGQLKGAIENSAAGRGVLNSGGTLYDLGNNLSNFISQDYGNVFNRAFTAWGGNRQNANDVYGRAWQNFVEQKDSFYKNQSNPFDKIARIASIGAGTAAQ